MVTDGHSKTPDTEKWSKPTTCTTSWICWTRWRRRSRGVLRMRFGLDDEEPKTLKEIGNGSA